MDERPTRLRHFFARYVAEQARANEPRIEQAFAAVPREAFAGPGPWQVSVIGRGYINTPDDDPAFLYQDTLVAINAARGINIGQPSLHARCLNALALNEGDQVVQIGAGVGYYTAILAQLVGPHGRVFAYEIEPDLAARARQNLQAYPWVEVRARSGIEDHLPKVAAVYVNAGITQPSWAWLDALRLGGRLMFPLQTLGGFGGILSITRPAGGVVWPAKFVTRAGFIACAGVQDAAAGMRLATAFANPDWQRVQAFRIDDPVDETCWFAGDGWWLSTASIVDPKLFDRYVGRYELRPNRTLTIDREADRLFAQITGRPRVELFAETELIYADRDTDIRITFETEGHGRTNRLMLRQDGKDEWGYRQT